jgi:hypothetical protein
MKIDYPYFNTKPMLCFTLDSVNYKQQTGNGTSTQLVQISNKVNDGYRFGFNGQEKVDEIAGAGNHNTAEFWEYDTRLARRWNRDPEYQKMSNESPYAVNHSNPIANCDPKGDFGFIGAALGATVGAIVEYSSQVASNLIQGKGLRDAFYRDVDFADVGISAGEGALIASTGGISLLAHAGFAAARVGVDASINGKLKFIGGNGAQSKANSDLMKDAASELLGLGIGKSIGALNLQSRVANSIINKESSINRVITSEGLGMLFDNSASGFINSVFDGIIHSEVNGNPFQKWGEELDTKHITLSPVMIHAKKNNSGYKLNSGSENKLKNHVEKEFKKHLND